MYNRNRNKEINSWDIVEVIYIKFGNRLQGGREVIESEVFSWKYVMRKYNA